MKSLKIKKIKNKTINILIRVLETLEAQDLFISKIKKQKIVYNINSTFIFYIKKLMFKTALIGVWAVYVTEVEPGKLDFLFFYVKIH